MSWHVERGSLSAADFHALDVPDPAERAVWVADPTAPALVLGSAQPETDVRDGADIEIVRRRSGGGAVLVVPGDVLWADVIVPAGDPLWDDDVGRASHWLGGVWAAALAELGVEGEVHRGPLERSPWAAAVCFAGRGPGEVMVDGRKVVGISQRRTRGAARFQCAALGRWDPSTLLTLLTIDARLADLDAMATGAGVPLDDLLAAFLLHLP
jgi:lipoate---protein ligase